MTLIVEKAIAPSYWASYLINGDDSGMEDREVEACDAWIARLGWNDPVDCVNYGFVHFHDAYNEYPFGSDCQEYSFLREDTAPIA